MPASIVIVLGALGFVIVEELAFLGLHYVQNGSLSLPDVLVVGCAAAVMLGVLLRSSLAWQLGRVLCWIGIVVSGVSLAVTVKCFQSGTMPAWTVVVLICNIVLLGTIYHGLGRHSAKEFLGVETSSCRPGAT